jgi:alkylated DNA repair dioxygenase AlkB
LTDFFHWKSLVNDTFARLFLFLICRKPIGYNGCSQKLAPFVANRKSNPIVFPDKNNAQLGIAHPKEYNPQINLMNLFDNNPGTNNLLPYDGIVHYYGKVLNGQQAQHYLQYLLEAIPWKNDEAYIFGKHIVTKRKVAWYGDDHYSYTYSGATKQALKWTAELLELKALAEKLTGSHYNSCLLNLYHDGEEGMAYHSDDEKALGKHSAIASLSFGAERKFLFRHKETKDRVEVFLEAGSLLVMKGETQTNWVHRLPPTKKVKNPRVNLTFRWMLV